MLFKNTQGMQMSRQLVQFLSPCNNNTSTNEVFPFFWPSISLELLEWNTRNLRKNIASSHISNLKVLLWKWQYTVLSVILGNSVLLSGKCFDRFEGNTILMLKMLFVFHTDCIPLTTMWITSVQDNNVMSFLLRLKNPDVIHFPYLHFLAELLFECVEKKHYVNPIFLLLPFELSYTQ